MKKSVLSINDKINDFTIVSKPYMKNKTWYVDVQCKCGTIQSKPTASKNKWTQCKKCNGIEKYRKYKAGDKKFNLTIIDYLPYDGSRVRLSVKCDCGNIFTTPSHLFGTTKTCRKCYDSQKGSKHPSYKGTKHISQTYFSQVKLNAHKRHLKFDLTIDDLDKLIQSQNFKCYLSGMEISINDKTASLDRIDSSKGYIKNNVAWCHKDINRIKSNFSNEYFIDICTNVYKTNHHRSV